MSLNNRTYTAGKFLLELDGTPTGYLQSFEGEKLGESGQCQPRAVDGGFLKDSLQMAGAGHQCQAELFPMFLEEFFDRDGLSAHGCGGLRGRFRGGGPAWLSGPSRPDIQSLARPVS